MDPSTFVTNAKVDHRSKFSHSRLALKRIHTLLPSSPTPDVLHPPYLCRHIYNVSKTSKTIIIKSQSFNDLLKQAFNKILPE